MSYAGFRRDIPGIAAAYKVADILQRAGYKGVLVGGSVRDILSGRIPDDYDMVTTAPPDKLAEIFNDSKFVGASFGVSLLKVDGISLELASARSERHYLDGRHPEQIVFTDDLSLDAARRDFTVNALMYDLISGELYDFTGGVEDLKKGVLRTVGKASERFGEDYLRMLRAVRFAANCNLEPDDECIEAVKLMAPQAVKISAERIYQELNRMLGGRNPEKAFRLLEKTSLLQYILPEVAALRQVGQPPQYHPEGDVLEHTLLMLRHMVFPDALTGWTVLFHDIGKKAAFSRDESGRIRFFNHETIGADMCLDICRRLHFSNSDTEKCVKAVRNHMRFASVTMMRQPKLRKLVADDNFALELELHRLDCIACHGIMDGFVYLLDYMNEHPGSTELPPPWVRGADLLRAGFKPSPRFKTVLESVYEQQLNNAFSSPAEALEAAKKLF